MSQKPVSLSLSRLRGEPEPQPAEQESAAPPAPPRDTPLSAEEIQQVRDRIIDVLRTVYDPELPVNVYDLGLVYDIYVQPDGAVNVRMTLTTPACPVAGSLPGEVERKVRSVPNVTSVKVDLVWDPPWDKNRMSEAAKLQLGLEDW